MLRRRVSVSAIPTNNRNPALLALLDDVYPLAKLDFGAQTMDHGAESFSRHINTKFRVIVESAEPVELGLVEVAVRKSEPNEHKGMERFSTFFYGPATFFLPQKTYDLVHPEMGEMRIFLVPIGQDDKGFKYEAVFNRFKND